jgi:hypothetical protein
MCVTFHFIVQDAIEMEVTKSYLSSMAIHPNEQLIAMIKVSL